MVDGLGGGFGVYELDLRKRDFGLRFFWVWNYRSWGGVWLVLGVVGIVLCKVDLDLYVGCAHFWRVFGRLCFGGFGNSCVLVSSMGIMFVLLGGGWSVGLG